MLRFTPDGIVEGLLRPLFMADPVAGLYIEDSAPDWRYAAFLVLFAAALLWRRRSLPLNFQQGVAIVGSLVAFYVWTFASGNGRYFAWGLVLAGPLLVMASMLLPTSRSLRWGVLLLVLGCQGVVMHLSHRSHFWTLVRVADDTVLLDPSPVREKPAVFITVSNLSYSILVPLFHPQSRWANIAGQYNVLPGTVEWPRLQALLASPLPRYLVTPVREEDLDPAGQPFGEPLHVLRSILVRQGLALVPGGCQTLWSALSGPGRIETEDRVARRGFWVCALEDRAAAPPPAAPAKVPVGSAQREAFEAVENRCPRFFPPGTGRDTLVENAHVRSYAYSDVRLWVHPLGVVMFQYYRAMNPTQLGTVDDVRAGRFTLPCDKLPGRYLPFWERD